MTVIRSERAGDFQLHQVSTAAEFRYAVATIRMPQNLKEYDLHDNAAMSRRFNYFWSTYKCVLQRSHWKSRAFRPVRCKPGLFWERVYRFGVASTIDWHMLSDSFGTEGMALTIVAKTLPNKLQKDFVKILLDGQCVYSVYSPEQREPVERDDVYDDVVVPYNGSPLTVFEVVDASPQKKGTAYGHHVGDMFHPIQVQFWRVVEALPVGRLTDPSTLVVHRDGDPEVVDANGISSMQQYFKTLRRWQSRAPSLRPGCVQISGVLPMRPPRGHPTA